MKCVEAVPIPELTMAMVILGHQQGASTGDRAASSQFDSHHSSFQVLGVLLVLNQQHARVEFLAEERI